VFFKGFHETPSGEFIDGCVLIKTLPFGITCQADRRDKFDVDLDALSGIAHGFVRLRDVLGIRRSSCQNALFSQEAIESGDGAGVSPLHELDPKDDQSGIWIASAHIRDELPFGIGMLVGVMVRFSGTVPKGFDRTIKTTFPTINILSVGLISDSGLGDTILIRVMNER